MSKISNDYGKHFAGVVPSASDQRASRATMRALNLVIVAMFVCVLSLFGFSWVLDHLDSPLSNALQLDRDRSNLEGKKYARFPEASHSSIQSSEFQNGVESFINDRMPRRDDILLTNASWQRSLISSAAVAHGYSVYPTFYNSAYVYDSRYDALFAQLEDADEAAVAQYELAAQAFSSFAASHPELNCYFYRVDRLSSSSNNPTNDLMNEVVNTEFLSEHFFSKLDEIEIINGLLPDLDASNEVFFRTDHHWNGPGAYSAYLGMFMEMQPEAEPMTDVEAVRYDVPAFYGSCSRAGLCVTNTPDTLEDLIVNLDDCQVLINGNEVGGEGLQHVEMYTAGEWDPERFTNRYAEYWHSDYASIEIQNPDSVSEESLLIVRDSFSAPVERYFSDYYRSIYVVDPRHSDDAIEEILSHVKADDVLFLMGSTTFSTDTTINFLQ